MSDFWWGYGVGIVTMFVLSALIVLWRRWRGSACASCGKPFLTWPCPTSARPMLNPLARVFEDHFEAAAAGPAESAAVPEDPKDWAHVLAYVDGFQAFLDRLRVGSKVNPAGERLSFTPGVFRYDQVHPSYVGHPLVRERLDWFVTYVVYGFESDLKYTLDEATADATDFRLEIADLCERVGPPAPRPEASRLQAQINAIKQAAAEDRRDRKSVDEIRATFGPGSFGGDPQPGSGPLG